MILQSKWNSQQSKETSNRMAENICKAFVWQGISIQNIYKSSVKTSTSSKIDLPSELEGKNLTTAHTLVTGYREINPELS